MQSTLKQFAEDALRNRGFDEYVDDAMVQEVITSLVEREETGALFMTNAGQDMGGSVSNITDAYLSSGLFVPDPQPEEVPPPEDETLAPEDGLEGAPAWFVAYAEKQDNLTKTVDGLVRLAERHLGPISV